MASYSGTAIGIQTGTRLVAKEEATVFAAPDSIDEVGSVACGEAVVAAGHPVDLGGFFMVPIEPTGAVQMDAFSVCSAPPPPPPPPPPPHLPPATAVGIEKPAATTVTKPSSLAVSVLPSFAASEDVQPPGRGTPSATNCVDAGSSTDIGSCEEFVSDDGQSLSFCKDLWDRLDLIDSQRLSVSRKLLDDFVVCLRDRALAERVYSQRLSQAVAKFHSHAQHAELPLAMEAMLANFQHRSEQSEQFAVDLETDVAATIEQMLRQHVDVEKRAFADGQRLSRLSIDVNKSHKDAFERCDKARTEAESLSSAFMQGASLPGQERLKLAAQSLAASRTAASAEKDYLGAVEKLNGFAPLHERHMTLVLGALQEVEEKRGSCLHDAAMKLAVYETSLLRNCQYDLDAVVKTVESSNPTDDLQAFIRRHRCNLQRPQTSAPVPFQSLVSVGGSVSTKSIIPSVSDDESKEICTLRPLIRGLLMGDVNVCETDVAELRARVSGEYVAEKSEGVAPRVGFDGSARSSLCAALRDELLQFQAHRSEGEATAEGNLRSIDDSDDKPVVLPMAAFDAVATLISSALDGCDRDGDAWSGRDLLVLSRAIQTEVDGKAVDVLLKVYNHSLWSRVTFWEDVLLIGLAEANVWPGLSRRVPTFAGDCAAAPTSAVTTPFLQRFVCYMVALGIKPEQARTCVQKTLQKHAVSLGSSLDAYAKELTRNLHASTEPVVASTSPSAAPSAVGVAETSSVKVCFSAVDCSNTHNVGSVGGSGSQQIAPTA
eukprot:TRINITY_DN74412_c0_g1_i1.p1 TRINITY_DN74412_c0_g1~~TRINITY_DN74412_c0_g1_i1.p1  ORF type:complete len:771 (+),score=165.33 TRINITY_DN74412_c0_g1_i1:78-2390(+)